MVVLSDGVGIALLPAEFFEQKILGNVQSTEKK